MFFSPVPCGQCRSQQAEVATGRAIADRRNPRYHRQIAIGLQQSIKGLRARLVAEEGAYLGEIGQRRASLGIVRKSEPCGCQRVEDPLRGFFVTEIARDQGETRPPGRLVRVFVEQPLDDWRHFRQPPLLAADGEHLHAVDALEMLALAAPAHLMRLLGKPFGTDKVTVEHGLHGASMPGYPTRGVVPTFLTPALILREGAVHTRPITELSRLVDFETDGAI